MNTRSEFLSFPLSIGAERALAHLFINMVTDHGLKLPTTPAPDITDLAYRLDMTLAEVQACIDELEAKDVFTFRPERRWFR